jgi:AcrR family transcriptional regulator
MCPRRTAPGAITLLDVTSTPPPAAAPRKRGPKSVLGNQPRDRIHDVASDLFERNGITATSMDDVARELGVSRPTLYYYYSNKEELLLEVVARQAGLILAELPHRLTATGVARVAEAAYLGLLASLDNAYVRLMIDGAAASLTGIALETPRVLQLQRAFWIPLLQHTRDHHGLRSDRPLDEIMEWIIFTQFSLATAGVAFGMSRDQMREKIDAYLIPALRGGPADGPTGS